MLNIHDDSRETIFTNFNKDSMTPASAPEAVKIHDHENSSFGFNTGKSSNHVGRITHQGGADIVTFGVGTESSESFYHKTLPSQILQNAGGTVEVGFDGQVKVTTSNPDKARMILRQFWFCRRQAE